MLLRALLVVLSILIVAPAEAQRGQARSWSDEKCARYAQAWSDAIARLGTNGLGPEFIRAHHDFLASGCRVRAVCPRTEAELRMADVLTAAAVNSGAPGSFLPFACRS